jgi:hypothetical protein
MEAARALHPGARLGPNEDWPPSPWRGLAHAVQSRRRAHADRPMQPHGGFNWPEPGIVETLEEHAIRDFPA